MTGFCALGSHYFIFAHFASTTHIDKWNIETIWTGLCRPSLPRVFLWSTTVFPCGPLGLLGILKHNVQHWVLQCIKSNNCCMQSQNAPESVLGVVGRLIGVLSSSEIRPQASRALCPRCSWSSSLNAHGPHQTPEDQRMWDERAVIPVSLFFASLAGCQIYRGWVLLRENTVTNRLVHN